LPSQGFFAKLSSLKSGLGSLPGEGFFGKVADLLLPGDDGIGLLGNLKNAGSYMLGAPRGSEAELLENLRITGFSVWRPQSNGNF
jgi:hypothetical protein